MGDLGQPLALVIVAVVTVVGSWLTTRASNRAAQRTAERTVAGQIETSRTQAEQNAYERARGFYEGVIERQDHEIAELETDVERLKNRVGELERELHDTREQLEIAKAALRLKFPDEP